MKTRFLKCGFIAVICCATAAALAQNPFAGTWKIDYAKSRITGDTMTLSPEANGNIHISADNMSYSAKTNGDATTNPMGATEHWTKIDDNDWKVVTTRGPLTVTETYKVTDNGKTLTDTATGTKPDGSAINSSSTYERIAPGKGIYGKWRNTKVSNDSPDTTVIEANGPNGIIWHIPEIKASVKLNFDGKEVAPEGPTVPHGLMLTATKTGPRSFRLIEKMNGKLLFTGHYTVSADGKTMTEYGRASGAAAPTKVVFQKS